MIFQIIIASYNDLEGLKETIKSITLISNDINVLIADGLSTDGTTEFLQKNKASNIQFFISADLGIYDAWNKAIEYSNADAVMFLGCGDLLLKDPMSYLDLSSLYMKKRMVSFPVEKQSVQGKFIRIDTWGGKFIKEHPIYKLPPHPGMIFPRRALIEAGGFSLNYRIVADSLMTLKLFSNGFKVVTFSHQPISVHKGGGISNSGKFALLKWREKRDLLKRYPFVKYSALELVVSYFKALRHKVLYGISSRR